MQGTESRVGLPVKKFLSSSQHSASPRQVLVSSTCLTSWSCNQDFDKSMENFSTYQTPLSRYDIEKKFLLRINQCPVDMQARRWQSCFHPLYIIFSNLTYRLVDSNSVYVIDALPYMAEAVAEPGHRGEGAGVAHFGRGHRANEGELGAFHRLLHIRVH